MFRRQVVVLAKVVEMAERKEDARRVVAAFEEKPVEAMEMLILDCQGEGTLSREFLEEFLSWYQKKSSEGKPALIFRGISEEGKKTVGELAGRFELVLHAQDAPSFPAYRIQEVKSD